MPFAAVYLCHWSFFHQQRNGRCTVPRNTSQSGLVDYFKLEEFWHSETLAVSRRRPVNCIVSCSGDTILFRQLSVIHPFLSKKILSIEAQSIDTGEHAFFDFWWTMNFLTSSSSHWFLFLHDSSSIILLPSQRSSFIVYQIWDLYPLISLQTCVIKLRKTICSQKNTKR